MNINWIWPADANKITPLQIDRVIIMPYLFPTQIALNIKPVAKRVIRSKINYRLFHNMNAHRKHEKLVSIKNIPLPIKDKYIGLYY